MRTIEVECLMCAIAKHASEEKKTYFGFHVIK